MAHRPQGVALLVLCQLATLHCSSDSRSFAGPDDSAGGDGAAAANAGEAGAGGHGAEGDGAGGSPRGEGGSGTGEAGSAGCDVGYDGANCQECAEGFARAGEDCVMACGSCAEHQECRLQPLPATCTCAATYELDEDGNCAFSEVLASPRFTEPGAWTLTGVTIDPTAFGPSAGSASFNDDAWCDGAQITQTVTMPPISLANPLVLEVHAERVGTSPYECNLSGTFPGMDLVVGGQTQLLGLQQNTAFGAVFKRSYCLGEAAFGGDVEFRFVGDRAGCSSGYVCPKPVLRELSVREAMPDECPTVVGAIANGRFASSEGWVLSADESNGLPGARAEAVNGRLELEGASTCSNVSATTAVSVPVDETLPHAALRFDVAGTLGSKARLSFGKHGMPLADELVGAGLGNSSEVTVCLPEFARGLVSEYRLQLLNRGGACNYPDAKTFYFDNMELVSEPACEHETLRDGGFELGSQLNASSWSLTDGAESCANCEGTARVVADADLAHSGSRVLELSFAGVEKFGTPSAEIAVRIPLATDAGGPAIKFWYRKTGSGAETLSAPGRYGIVGTATWTEHTVCLSDYPPGAIRTFTFSSLKAATVGSTHYVDDVRVELDPSCQ